MEETVIYRQSQVIEIRSGDLEVTIFSILHFNLITKFSNYEIDKAILSK